MENLNTDQTGKIRSMSENRRAPPHFTSQDADEFGQLPRQPAPKIGGALFSAATLGALFSAKRTIQCEAHYAVRSALSIATTKSKRTIQCDDKMRAHYPVRRQNPSALFSATANPSALFSATTRRRRTIQCDDKIPAHYSVRRSRDQSSSSSDDEDDDEAEPFSFATRALSFATRVLSFSLSFRNSLLSFRNTRNS